MSRLRVGVVGVGALGRHHARILSEMPDVELVAVADSHAERGQDVAAKCRTKWVADYRQLLADVDAVSVVVPTVAHLSVASEFLRRGIPVMVEKPIAQTLAAAQELVELAHRNRTILQVGHTERFNPAWQAALPSLHEPKYLRAERLAPFTFRSTDIGVVLDLMIHDLDLVLALVHSPIRSVEAFGVAVMGPHEDVVQARLTFENGCLADLTASRLHPQARRSLLAWSRTGCVNVDLHQRTVSKFAPTPTLLHGDSPVSRAQQPGADIEALKSAVFGQFVETNEQTVPPQDALTLELAAFLDCVRHRRQPLVNGETALQALIAADRVLSAVAAHQWDGHAGGIIGPHLLGTVVGELRRAG
jgi:predicted dehydrogenase